MVSTRHETVIIVDNRGRTVKEEPELENEEEEENIDPIERAIQSKYDRDCPPLSESVIFQVGGGQDSLGQHQALSLMYSHTKERSASGWGARLVLST